MVFENPENKDDNERRRRGERPGMDNLVVIAIFVAAILLLTALLYFAY